jgi:hypothetical protein
MRKAWHTVDNLHKADIMSNHDTLNRNILHTYTLVELRELAMRDCSQYSADDLAIAWELFDRLVEGGRIAEAQQPTQR